ncbi:MAG: hypothetical protein AB7L76_00190 [Burkholderiaceae bacterium]
MKTLLKVLIPAAVSLAAVGAHAAQPINYETDYPGPFPAAAAQAQVQAPAQSEPYLIQYGEGAAEVNPLYRHAAKPASRDEVRSKAAIVPPQAPGFNA